VFLPRPKVDSALVRIQRRAHPAVADVDPAWLFQIVRAGFAHRRKMLRGALSGLVDADTFGRAGVEPTSRAEDLDVAAWAALARAAPPPESL
jgi:16S rRNA (adenine1518-N6/adenine1519-N6)-dimethyltransferase